MTIHEETAEIIRRQTEKKYGELKNGETMSGMLDVNIITMSISNRIGSWRPLSYDSAFDSAAPTRISAVEQPQQDMMRDCHYGILSGDTDFDISQATRAFSSAIPLLDPLESTTMPESWVRAQILVSKPWRENRRT